MKRLTRRGKKNRDWVLINKICNKATGAFCPNAHSCDQVDNRTCPYLEVLDRLCEYEDTNLEPSEILALKAENARLNANKVSGCAWCKGDWTDNFSVIDENFGQPLTYRHVKFCPMCGRKLRSPAEERERRRAKMKSEATWYPVKERLPESGEEVIACYLDAYDEDDSFLTCAICTYHKAGDILENEMPCKERVKVAMSKATDKERIMSMLFETNDVPAEQDGFYFCDANGEGLMEWRRHNDEITHWRRMPTRKEVEG